MLKKTLVLMGGVAVAAILFSCGGESVTGPSPTPEQTSVQPTAESVAEAPQTVVTPPEPTGTIPVSWEGTGNCGGILTNQNPATHNVEIHYTPPQVPAGQADYLVAHFTVPGNGQTKVPTAQKVFEEQYEIPEPGCEPWSFSADLQCDVVTGRGGHHIGGPGGHVSLSVPALPVEKKGEPTVEVGDWLEGRCPGQVSESFISAEWQHQITTTTQTFQCADDEVNETCEERRCVYVVDYLHMEFLYEDEPGECERGLFGCHETHYKHFILYETGNCGRRVKDEDFKVPVINRCDCPVEQGLCHVSNTGNPNSGEVELRVQWKRSGAGHENHCADYVPGLTALEELPEISCRLEGPHSERCSCEQAIANWRRCDAQ